MGALLQESVICLAGQDPVLEKVLIVAESIICLASQDQEFEKILKVAESACTR